MVSIPGADHPLPQRPTDQGAKRAPKPPKAPALTYASFTSTHPLYNDSTKQAAARQKRQQDATSVAVAEDGVAGSSKKRPGAARTHDDTPSARGVVDVRRQKKKASKQSESESSRRVIAPASGSSVTATMSPASSSSRAATGAADFVPLGDGSNGRHLGAAPANDGQRRDVGKGKGKASDAQQSTEQIEPWARDREATKILLADPARVEWPTISASHGQAILHALLQAFPGLATYHLERDRLNRLANKKLKGRRKAKAHEAGGAGKAGRSNTSLVEAAETSGIHSTTAAADLSTEKSPVAEAHVSIGDNESLQTVNPPPDLLSHLVFGINEVSKRMEKQIAWLAEEADVLCGEPVVPRLGGSNTLAKSSLRPRRGVLAANLVPTAPVEPIVEEGDADMEPSAASTTNSTPNSVPPPPLRIIYVCQRDVNPPALVEAIPQYARSWNAVARACRSRLAQVLRDLSGTGTTEGTEANLQDRERLERALRACVEALVVPLPAGAEYELAMASGLRRVAVVGMTSAFPNLSTLLNTLRSAAVPVMLPPFPLFPGTAVTSTIAGSIGVHPAAKPHPAGSSAASSPIATGASRVASAAGGDAPPFAPTSLKYLSTSAPLDPKARKAHRVSCVRKRRLERKEAKRAAWESAKRKMQDQARRYVNASAKYDKKRKATVVFTEGRRKNVP